MAIIKEGYNGKPLEIKVSGRRDSNSAEVWLTQAGLVLPPEFQKYKDTLSYASIQELVELKQEIEQAIKDMAGI